MPNANEPVAIVTPWFDDGANGSALLSSQLVHELFALDQRVDVLATCARSFHDDWSKNYYAEGTTRLEHYTLRRFAVRARDRETFDRANAFLTSQTPDFLKAHPSCIPEWVREAFGRENIQSPALLQYLADWGRTYRAVIFTPYLYGPVLDGLRLVAERAFLQPCLHDEGYAYLPQTAELFARARGLLFNSRAEYDLACRLYGPAVPRKGAIVGHWVQPPQLSGQADRAVPRGRYLLYIGRAGTGKNVEMLLKAFGDYRRYNPSSHLQLVAAGEGCDALQGAPGVRLLSRVSETRKSALLRSCTALVQPSINESFSRSVMEAWSYGKPVAVNAACEATSAAVKACGGGWAASTSAEWAAVFTAIERAPAQQLRERGELGRAHYARYGTPGHALQRYRDVLGLERALPAAAHR